MYNFIELISYYFNVKKRNFILVIILKYVIQIIPIFKIVYSNFKKKSYFTMDSLVVVAVVVKSFVGMD